MLSECPTMTVRDPCAVAIERVAVKLCSGAAHVLEKKSLSSHTSLFGLGTTFSHWPWFPALSFLVSGGSTHEVSFFLEPLFPTRFNSNP